jgi:hypothetical protein
MESTPAAGLAKLHGARRDIHKTLSHSELLIVMTESRTSTAAIDEDS